MILGNRKIEELLKDGLIRIEPFNPEQLQGTSYDLRLDKYFIISTYCNSVRGFKPALEDFQGAQGISGCITLKPHQRVLASTIEKAGSKSLNVTTSIHSKSSWGRHGLEVCSCAGYGDPGYCTHWTLEIFNKNSYPVTIQRGMVIAQISFELVTGCDILYNSKYNNNGEDRAFTNEERFEMMMPKRIKLIL